jgi:hypothetical protein
MAADAGVSETAMSLVMVSVTVADFVASALLMAEICTLVMAGRLAGAV